MSPADQTTDIAAALSQLPCNCDLCADFYPIVSRPEPVAEVVPVLEQPEPVVEVEPVLEKPSPSKAKIAPGVLIEQFRERFYTLGISGAMQALFETCHADYYLVLTALKPFFHRIGCASGMLWSEITKVYTQLPEEVQARCGGPIASNDYLVYFLLDYMTYRVSQKSVVSASVKDVQEVLASVDPIIFNSTPQAEINTRIDTLIMMSSLPDCNYRELSATEGKEYLMKMFRNMQAYSAKRIAVVMVKLAWSFADLGAMQMILAFGDSPFSDVLKHIKYINLNDDREAPSFRDIMMPRQ